MEDFESIWGTCPSKEYPNLSSKSFGKYQSSKFQTFSPFTFISLIFLNSYQFLIKFNSANPTDIKFDTIIYIPKLDISGKYKMTFKFLGNPVNSDGDYYSQLTGPKLKFSMKGHRYVKNGQEFFKFEPFAVKFNRGKVSQLKISNLFGGNKLMADIVHSIILRNPDFVLQNVYPKIEANLSKILTALANKVVEKSSYDEMFPL